MSSQRRTDDDFAAEIQSHIELETDRLIAEGMSPADARDAARRRFGNATASQERFYESRRWLWLEQFFQDLRYGVRAMRHAPVFTIVAVLSLALGIGANTACFSLVDALLLKSLPVSAPEDIRVVWTRQSRETPHHNQSGYGTADPTTGERITSSFCYPAYALFRDHVNQFAGLLAFAPYQFSTTVKGQSDFTPGTYVSGNYFDVLGVQPVLGRGFVPEDDRASSPLAVVISHVFWEKRFGKDPAALGAQVLVNGQPATVVGILGPGFGGLDASHRGDVFVPINKTEETGAVWYKLTATDDWWVQVFGRIRPGVSNEAAAAAMQGYLAQTVHDFAGPKAFTPAVVVRPGGQGVPLLRSRFSNPMIVLSAIVGIVLLAACANLANLLLARSAARVRELAIRLSIGAGRWRLVRQLLTESLLLASIGATLGVLLATPIRELMVTGVTDPGTLNFVARTDLRALMFTLGATLLTAVLFGALPALRGTRLDLMPSLRGAGAGGSRSNGAPRTAQFLIAAQVAMSLLLLVGAALFVRTLNRLYSVDLGIRTDHLLTFQTDPAKNGYKDQKLMNVYDRLEHHLAEIPGVQAVGFTHSALLRGWSSNDSVIVDGEPELEGYQKSCHFLYGSASMFEAYGIALRQGRMFDQRDSANGPTVAVVNETFARRFIVGKNPIGRTFYRSNKLEPGLRAIQIVGVVKDAHYDRVNSEVPATAYYLYTQWPDELYGMTVALRSSLPPSSLGPIVRRAVAEVDPLIPVAEMVTQDAAIARLLGTERLFAGLVTSFGVMAALLAAIGLYGILAYAVARRTSEICIRLALGATRGSVRWLVVKESLGMVLLGLLVGVPLALGLSRYVESMLYGVKPTDPASVAAAIVAMVVVAGVAAWIPASRASRVDPNAALRCE